MVIEVSSEPVHISTSEVAARHGDAPWSEVLLNDGRNLAVLIANNPGEANDAHVHPDFNEWWIVMQGELIWEVGDYPPIHAKKGDVVISPAGTRHSIKTVGTEMSLRMGITNPEGNHDTKGERGTEVPFPDQSNPPNLIHTTIDKMFEIYGEPPWSDAVLADDRNRANLICHGPGMSNNAHWHPDFDEWWTILKGELTWKIGEDRPMYNVKEGDIIFVPKGMRHHISTVGDETSLRLAVTTPEALHIYTDDDDAAPPPKE